MFNELLKTPKKHDANKVIMVYFRRVNYERAAENPTNQTGLSNWYYFWICVTSLMRFHSRNKSFKISALYERAQMREEPCIAAWQLIMNIWQIIFFSLPLSSSSVLIKLHTWIQVAKMVKYLQLNGEPDLQHISCTVSSRALGIRVDCACFPHFT